MSRFKAFRIHSRNGHIEAGFERITLDDLSPGDVLVRARYSGINYKDALAATGKGAILRTFPLVGGIDVAGVVERSSNPRINPGDEVLVCGCGLSETRDGGYAELVRLPAECVIPLPDGLSLFEAMAIGTAGFTAALAVDKLERCGQTAAQGPMLVTGASGGVGNFAIDLLSHLGYEVVAVSGKPERFDDLKALGAGRVLDRRTLEPGQRALEKGQWGGAIDCVGGPLLAWLTRTVRPMGNIAVIGLTGGIELNTTVMPFILRGISLLGINSVICPQALKEAVWQRLASDLKPRHIDRIVTAEIPFDDLPDRFESHIRGEISGRTVVRIGD